MCLQVLRKCVILLKLVVTIPLPITEFTVSQRSKVYPPTRIPVRNMLLLKLIWLQRTGACIICISCTSGVIHPFYTAPAKSKATLRRSLRTKHRCNYDLPPLNPVLEQHVFHRLPVLGSSVPDETVSLSLHERHQEGRTRLHCNAWLLWGKRDAYHLRIRLLPDRAPCSRCLDEEEVHVVLAPSQAPHPFRLNLHLNLNLPQCPSHARAARALVH